MDRRELEHKHFHHGTKFIKDSGTDFKIIYKEKYPNRISAMRREKQLKGWSRAKKEALINNELELLKKL